MDPPDDNIQFDFFDEEPATAESASTPPPSSPPSSPRVRLPQRPRRRQADAGAGAPPHSTKPLIRLLALVASIVFLVLVFALLIQSCAGTSTHDTYANYVDKVNTIAQQSNKDGANTVAVFTTQGLTTAQIAQKLNTIGAEESQNLSAAQSISPPGKLRTQHANMIQALQLRVSGVNGLAKAMHESIGGRTNPNTLALVLTQETYALLASDVIWSDLYQGPAQNVIDQEGVHQVTVPSSHFLAVPDLIITQRAWQLILQRINGAGSGSGSSSTGCTGLHGTNISQVAALPNGVGGKTEVLTTGSLNTVTTSTSLLIQVTIYNGGNSQEVQIPVTLTVPQSQGGPITRTQTVQLIDPGKYSTVTFNDLGEVPFDTASTLQVDVAKVPCETNIANNSGSYKVLFTLPS